MGKRRSELTKPDLINLYESTDFLLEEFFADEEVDHSVSEEV